MSALDVVVETLSHGKPLPNAMAQLVIEVTERFGVDSEELFAPGRGMKHVAEARHVIAWVARKRWRFSFPALGKFLNRDHTTIIASVERIEIEVKLRSELGTTALEFYDPTRLRMVAGEGVVLELDDGGT